MDYNITYRDKDGGIQFIISYKDHNGKWRQKSKQGFKKMREAKKTADEMLDKLKENYALKENYYATQLSAKYDGITFGGFLEMYLKHIALHKEGNTVRSYRAALKKFQCLNDMELSEISSLDIQQCIDKMVEEGLKASSIRLYLSKISTIFNFALKLHKIISNNPASEALIIPESKDSEKIKALTKPQLDKLLESIKNPKQYIVTAIAAKTGLRLGEILGLTWKDINFNEGTLTVNKQWKIRKDGTWGLGPVKRKRSNRIVPVPSSLLTALKEYRKTSPMHFDGRIVPYKDTQSIGTVLRYHYKKNGFNITVHDLRHTFATMLLAEGVDFETVAKLLGHDVNQTIQTYSHVTSDMIYRAAKVVNKVFE